MSAVKCEQPPGRENAPRSRNGGLTVRHYVDGVGAKRGNGGKPRKSAPDAIRLMQPPSPRDPLLMTRQRRAKRLTPFRRIRGSLT